MKTRQSTRDKILDAVFTLVYINGYNGTSIDMILKKSNTPKGSLYHYFKSKKEMVLAVIQERIAPRMHDFYELEKKDNEHSIDAIIKSILKISNKNELISYGCPLNRLNQEMSPIDEDFEREINKIYLSIKNKIINLLENSVLQKDIYCDTLAEFIIASIWGNISLSPTQSSKNRYLNSIKHLINYLKSIKQ